MPSNRKASIDQVVDAYVNSGRGIDFKASTHTYTLDGFPVPSVTQFLDIIAQHEYDNISPHYRNNAALVGTMVHAVTEHIDAGNDIDVHRLAYELLSEQRYISADSNESEIEYYMNMLCSSIDEYADAYSKAIKFYQIVPVAAEVIVGYRDTPFSYAGKLDRIAIIDGQPAIIDIKTSKSISRLAKLQLTAYGMCAPKYAKEMTYAVLHMHRPRDRVIVDLDRFSYDEYYERLVMAALELYFYMR